MAAFAEGELQEGGDGRWRWGVVEGVGARGEDELRGGGRGGGWGWGVMMGGAVDVEVGYGGGGLEGWDPGVGSGVVWQNSWVGCLLDAKVCCCGRGIRMRDWYSEERIRMDVEDFEPPVDEL